MIYCRNLLLLLFLAGLAHADSPDSLPHHTIYRATGPIAVDGHLNEIDWREAPIVDQFTYPWFIEGEKEHTAARLLWDDENLYVSFVAYDHHISAQYTERDDPVSRDDCVEVFIAPDPLRLHNYFNFEFNALGTTLDRSPHDNRSGIWNTQGLQIATQIEGTLNEHSDKDERWLTEIAIPLINFSGFVSHLPPQEGDSWRLNLYRTGGQINLQYATWSNTLRPKPQFHAPERFGIVHFSTQNVRKLP
jgi:hypothetical protein